MRFFRHDGFFDAKACSRIRHALDRGTTDPAELLEDDVRVDDQVRRTSSIEVDAATLAFVEQALDEAQPRIAAFHAVSADSREGVGFLRYPPGGFYRLHRDRAHSPHWPGAARRRITLVVFLNDDFGGGELQLVPDDQPPVTVTPRAGTLVAFDAAILHQVLPVNGGTRDSLVDWLLGDSSTSRRRR